MKYNVSVNVSEVLPDATPGQRLNISNTVEADNPALAVQQILDQLTKLVSEA